MVDNRETRNVRMIFRLPVIPAWRMPIFMAKPRNPLSSTLFLFYGFLGLSVLGAILLVFPISSQSGQWTSPLIAWFTSVSAVCVTGLVVVDTGTYWNNFGQGVLFALFQIGGLGFIASATILLLAIGRRFGLREKLFVSESMGIDRLGGMLGVVLRIIIFALIVEAVSAIIMYFYLIAKGTQAADLWTIIFHAASAFNNAGMDLFGKYQSLTGFTADAVIIIVTSVLIMFGSIGYVVVADILKKRNFTRLTLDSKIILVTTFSLLLLGTIFYFALEYNNAGTLGSLSFSEKTWTAFFQSCTARSSGFTAIDINELKPVSLFFTMFLMFIGGAAGSVAGGIKVSSLGIVVMTVVSALRGKQSIEAFGRQISRQTAVHALTLITFYTCAIGIIVLILSIFENQEFNKLLFETFSALGTVGLSTGITPDLTIAGKLVIILTMFMGRLGPLALMAYLVHHTLTQDIEYPHDTIKLG